MKLKFVALIINQKFNIEHVSNLPKRRILRFVLFLIVIVLIMLYIAPKAY